MVQFGRFVLSTVLFAALASARPIEDSAVGEEVAVSAPNGIPMSDTAALATRTADNTAAKQTSSMMDMDKEKMQKEKDMKDKEKMDKEKMDKEKMDKEKMDKEKMMQDKDKMKHGSGKSNWGGSGYDDCVQKCMSKHGKPPTEWKPTATSGQGGSKGTGPTHTVVVAPTQGVLRYVPFALNASVGDTILFRWNANNHTVTKSSALQPCNKTSDNLFTSGTHDKDFEFTQVVNDTSTVWFYCNTPTHCQKGMFGALNAPNSFGSPTSVTLKAQDLAAKSPDMAAMWAKMEQDTKGNDKAASWGGNLDMKGIPDWAMTHFVANVMYTRSFLAANPETLKDDGTIDFSNAANSPLKFPQDIAVPLNAAQTPAATTPASSTPASSATSTDTSTSTASAAAAGAMKNSASSSSAPAVLFTVMAIVFTFIAM